jgi:hypothetical protein
MFFEAWDRPREDALTNFHRTPDSPRNWFDISAHGEDRCDLDTTL